MNELNETLVTAVREKDSALNRMVPDIINYHDNVYATFAGAGAGSIYDEVFMDRYYEYLEARGIDLTTIEVSTLQRHQLVLTHEDGAPRERFSIFKSFV